ncbi:MAG: AAA family ATPase [Bacteroides sp.]
MNTCKRVLPIGGQDFSDLRRNGFIYVDKTHFVADLVSASKYYFLSRPRRFGKSLFLSTLKAYFEGKKECFEGLYLEKWEEAQAAQGGREAWQQYPVLYLDLNAKNYESRENLENVLDRHLLIWENKYGVKEKRVDLEDRFQSLLRYIYETTHQQVIVLVDEYDKPLLLTLEEGLEDLNNEYRRILKGFFAVLKSGDPYLRFVFLTGVSRFSKISLFSDLNHLNDISLNRDYSSVCGITEEELKSNFQPEIKALSESEQLTYEETLEKLKQTYDGYLFIDGGEHVYNPFSLLNVFSDRMFFDYWFQSGTPTFLVQYLKKAHFYLPDLENNVEIDLSSLNNFKVDVGSPIPILYQAGYLTLKSYNRRSGLYSLGYPNNEVKYGLIRNLLPSYSNLDETKVQRFVWQFYEKVCSGDVASFMQVISDLLANIPYSSASKDDVRWREQNYQIAVALIFQFMGMYTQTEVYSAKGRADCVVYTEHIIYIFEFKLWSAGTAEEALAQIQEQEYYKPLRLQGKKLVLIGTSFDEEKRNIKEWKSLEIHAL